MLGEKIVIQKAFPGALNKNMLQGLGKVEQIKISFISILYQVCAIKFLTKL